MIHRFKSVCVTMHDNKIIRENLHQERFEAILDVETGVDLNHHCVGFVYDRKTQKVVYAEAPRNIIADQQ